MTRDRPFILAQLSPPQGAVAARGAAPSRSAPTPAKSASPRPRGEGMGMGVGGRRPIHHAKDQ